MSTLLSFFVAGEPVAQPRPRACRRGKFVSVYDPGTADEWKKQVKAAWGKLDLEWSRPLDGPLHVKLWFWMPRPKDHFNKRRQLKPSAPRYCEPKPDFDNLAKAVCDALTTDEEKQFIGPWHDDRQICECYVSKCYVRPGSRPGCFITIETL